jgi:prepilin-type N-terminal cleavage/methylation domain-containing protein
MKNKGFTLVELLAVIAILAILVIVAMPNVLGMFNQAKVSSFATEVQKLMDTATTTFTKDSLKNSGQTVYYSNVDNASLKTNKLDMSGNEKNYFIEMDRNGNFKRVVVYDENYCYDVYTNYGSSSSGNTTSTKSKLIDGVIQKTTVNASDVWESGNDSVNVNISGSNYVVNGCQGIITVDGKNSNVSLPYFTISGTKYYFEDGMQWQDWVNTSYNTLNAYLAFSIDEGADILYAPGGKRITPRNGVVNMLDREDVIVTGEYKIASFADPT